MFGPHVVIDSIIKEVPSEEKVRKFLEDIPDQISMTKITVPIINKFDRGIYGIVIIAESHISILAQKYDEHILFQVDIFSCKNFDREKAVEFTKKVFGCKKLVDRVIMRGTAFPREIPYEDI